jgi:transposase-like protein
MSFPIDKNVKRYKCKSPAYTLNRLRQGALAFLDAEGLCLALPRYLCHACYIARML